MYNKFVECVKSNDTENMERIAKDIETEINKALYKEDESGLKVIYSKLQELKTNLVKEADYNNFMEKESVYFYTGMIYAYYNICGMYYTMIRKEKDKVEIKEFNKDCYEKLKKYLVGKGQVPEDVIEADLGISRNKIMSCVNSMILNNERSVNMDMKNGVFHYYLDSNVESKMKLKGKVGDTQSSFRIQF